MSLVSCVMASLYSTRAQSDAEYKMAVTSNRMMNRVRNAGRVGFGSRAMWAMHRQENNDMARLQTLSLQRTIHQSMAESFGKMARENIKSSFSIMA